MVGGDGKQKAYTCFNCLNYFGSEKLLHKHYEFDCSRFGDDCRVEFPNEEERFIKFEQYTTKLENSIVFYIDIESSLPKLNQINKDKQATVQESIHIPNSFAIYSHCRFDENLSECYLFKSENDNRDVSELLIEKVIGLRNKYMSIINHRKKIHKDHNLTKDEQILYNSKDIIDIPVYYTKLYKTIKRNLITELDKLGAISFQLSINITHEKYIKTRNLMLFISLKTVQLPMKLKLKMLINYV